MRLQYESGRVHPVLLLGKVKVASQGANTIPCLELNGCLVSYRLVQTILKEMELPVMKIHYWTDSTVCLRWIYSQSCLFHIYVGNRVAELHGEDSLVECRRWRYVPTKENPADDCSRGLDTLKPTDRWFTGPDFLKLGPEKWPLFPDKKQLEPGKGEVDPEVRSTGWMGLHLRKEPTVVETMLSDCYERKGSIVYLKRTMGFVFRFLKRLVERVHEVGRSALAVLRKGETKGAVPTLTTQELEGGMRILIRDAQKACYPEKVRDLKGGMSQVKLNSPLLTLTPYIDKDGLIRFGGRLVQADSEINGHPYAIPGHHPITKAIVWRTHITSHHLSAEGPLAEVRKDFWFAKGRQTVQSYIRPCWWCIK